MKKGSAKSHLQLVVRHTLIALFLSTTIVSAFSGAPLGEIQHHTAIDKTVTGKVSSKDDNTGIPGVTVVVKGSTTGTTTDVDGKYQIEVKTDNDILVFSAVGFLTQEKPVGNASTVDIILSTDQKTLDEVVVVGYGTLKKRDLTGAVSQINATKLDNENPQSVQDVLRGNIPGMTLVFQHLQKAEEILPCAEPTL